MDNLEVFHRRGINLLLYFRGLLLLVVLMYWLCLLEGVRCTLLMFGRLHCLGLLAYQECVVLFVFRGAHCSRGCLSIPARILGLPV